MGYKPVVGWGTLPDGWSFVEATAVAVDAHDDVWVFNRGAHPVIVFDREGAFKRAWGEGVIRRAHGITIGPDGTIWLTDDLHHTVRQFTPAGKLLLTIGDPDTPSTAHGGKPFNRPTHVAISPRTGEVYVSDGYGNSRVHKYDPTGRLLKSWGAPGTDPGCFNIPHNIATDAGGRVYVADRENSRVQVFDEDGAYLDQWKNLHRPCGLAAAARLGDLFFARELAVDQGRPRRAHRRAVCRREAWRVRGAARLRGGFARGSLCGGGVLDGGGQERKSAARDPLAAEVHADLTLDEAALGAALARLPGW